MSRWARASNAKPGKPYIPDRKDMNEKNRPAREVAAARKKGGKK